MARFRPDDSIRCTECDNTFTLKEATSSGDGLDKVCPDCGSGKDNFKLA